MTSKPFIYLWHDKLRNMFYIGSHDGTLTDNYISSSRWLNGEINYRPDDFRRKIVKFVDAENLKKEEYRLIKKIKDAEYGTKYYNLKCGRKKGGVPYNKGKTLSAEHISKMKEAFKGRQAWNKNVPNPVSAENGRKSAAKVALKAKGRKIAVREDGTRYWVYPVGAS